MNLMAPGRTLVTYWTSYIEYNGSWPHIGSTTTKSNGSWPHIGLILDLHTLNWSNGYMAAHCLMVSIFLGLHGLYIYIKYAVVSDLKSIMPTHRSIDWSWTSPATEYLFIGYPYLATTKPGSMINLQSPYHFNLIVDLPIHSQMDLFQSDKIHLLSTLKWICFNLTTIFILHIQRPI